MARRQYSRQILIRKVDTPPEPSPESKLEWICECLGINPDDDLAREIFKSLVRASENGKGVSTRELKDRAHVTQGAIVYHMNVFIRSGMIVKQGRMYYLRANSLEDTIEEMENEMLAMMNRMRKIARLLEDEFRMQEGSPREE